jgi:NAD(P)-dependent dehydrogenase (short-subunit alcohol dehydrogenase family)
MMDFTGKTIVLAGAGGIGTAIAELLASLGARMILLDVVEDKLKEVVASLSGEKHAYYVCDFSAIESIETLIARGELVRSEYNQQITTPDGGIIGANLNEAVAYFDNPANKDVRNVYEAKLEVLQKY